MKRKHRLIDTRPRRNIPGSQISSIIVDRILCGNFLQLTTHKGILINGNPF
jgi:hypothetical protein